MNSRPDAGTMKGMMSSTSSRSSRRSTLAIQIGLILVLALAVGIGSYLYFSRDGAGSAAEGESTTTQTTPGEPGVDATAPARATPFTTADAGTCLTWEVTASGEVEDFERISCEEPHRFEVSSREDLATYPASEFGPDSAIPNTTRQAQLREELCLNPTVRYLDGAYDPLGRYSVASILPPPERWENGDRTLLCGVQSTDNDGHPVKTTGYAAEQDQARVAQPGECQYVDGSNSLSLVDCAEDHHIEITSVTDLAPVFPDRAPSVEEQDGHLRDVCTEAAIDYLGEEENLYQSTLQPYWNVIPRASWEGGSHSTNCGLVHANEDTEFFSVLNGSATEGPEGFTIDGTPPPPQPDRDPIRSSQPDPAPEDGTPEGAVPGEVGAPLQ